MLSSLYLIRNTPRKAEVWPTERLAKAQLPNDATRWQTVIPVIEDLKVKARKLGLWNLFLSKAHYPKHGVPLTNLEVWPPPCLSSPCQVTSQLVRCDG